MQATDLPSFGRWLKERRQAYGYTQKELAREAGCSVQTIRKIESGERRPSRQIAELLAQCLEVEADEWPALLRFARTSGGERRASRLGQLPPPPVPLGRAPLVAGASGWATRVPEQQEQEQGEPPTNLPAPLTSFVGRRSEIARLHSLLELEQIRLVTLTGPPGVGKTRLALRVAAGLLERFSDGVFFVPLSPVADPDLVAPAIARVLGVRDAPDQPLVETLKHYLHSKRILLVLDNFEGLLPAGAALTEILSAAPGVRLLATSREILHLYGEQQFPVPPLGLPDNTYLTLPENLSQFEATRLFVERALSANPDFTVTNDNAPAVVEICSRLDGLPLAIELAAARIALLSPQAILTRLQSRLDLLTGGARDRPARQQTLRNAFEWSHDLLDESEKILFRRLSVFGSSFSLEAAEAVCNVKVSSNAGSGQLPRLSIDVLDGVISLTNKSLLRKLGTGDEESRFGMLGTIREFALERLSGSGEAEALRREHALYFVKFLEDRQPQFLLGNVGELFRSAGWVAGNVRIALDWILEHNDFESVDRMGYSLAYVWSLAGAAAEGQKWIRRAFARAEQVSWGSEQQGIRVRALLLRLAGHLDFLQGLYSSSRERLEESVTLHRQLGDRVGLAIALHTSGIAARFQSDYEIARSRLEEAIQLNRELGMSWMLALALFSLGDVNMAQGKDEDARARYEESLAVYRRLDNKLGTTFPLVSLGRLAWLDGDYTTAYSMVSQALRERRAIIGSRSWRTAIALDSLSEVTRCLGNYDESADLAAEALDVYRGLDDRSGTAWSLYNLGYAAHHRRDHERAAGLFKEALALRAEQGNKEGVTLCLAGLAAVAAASGEYERGAQLYGCADALLDAFAARLSPFDRNDYEQNRALARSALGEVEFAAGLQRGRAMSMEEAIEHALRAAGGGRGRLA